MKNHEILPVWASGGGYKKPIFSRCLDSGGHGETTQTLRKDPLFGAFLLVFSVLLALIFTVLAPFTSARAQDGQPGILANGDLAVTGFSGTKQIGDQTFIDTGGVSLKVFDVSGRGNARSQVISAPVKYNAFARDIGQVFGVALDKAPRPNIYATATSAHGLQIVIPDNNGDGIPERVNTGQPGATFMEGQFGTALGGGPGSVWRIDGTTGEIKLFADIKLAGMPNSGPGLGNIAFDPAHYQFYVSDLDTGLIHRLDLSGNDLGTYDHGVQGRPAAGLPQVVMNIADRMDITNPAFNSTDSTTWNLADKQRRVWGLAYYSGRLYYGVGDGPQIWSVGVNTDGGFTNDARVEIQQVPGGTPVSDILFTPRGKMVLAQRGGIVSSQDYTKYHTPKNNSVLRYSRDETGNWVQVPQEYAIGFPVDHKNASGGVALTCDGTLWSTGDALRNDPAQAASLLPGGALVVHGLQGNKISLVRPFNTPPRASWFVDYDSQFADPEKAGHVGDVEVYRNCAGGRAESFPGWYPIPEWYPPEGWVPPEWWPEYPDLDLEKSLKLCGKLSSSPVSYICKYQITVTNVGAADYVGKIHVADNPPATGNYLPPAGGSIPWNCTQPGGAGTPIACDSTNVETLLPGEAETLDITISVTPAVKDKSIVNCAIVDDPYPGNNKDCAEYDLPGPDLNIHKRFRECLPFPGGYRCFFMITVTNVGMAPYQGPLHFVDNAPPGTSYGGIWYDLAPTWTCSGGTTFECKLPDPPGITLNPGDAEKLGVYIIVPVGITGDMENCVYLANPEHADDPVAPGVNKSCVKFSVPTLPDLEIKKTFGECHLYAGLPSGYRCDFTISITNVGTAPYQGPLHFTETPPPGVFFNALYSSTTPGWACVPGPTVECTLPNPPGVTLNPGDVEVVKIFIIVPSALPDVTGQMENCVNLANPEHAGDPLVPGVNKSCVPFSVPVISPQQQSPADSRPFCRKGETKYRSTRQIPQNWTWRKVTLGKRTIYCAKPRILIQIPSCRKGETLYGSARQIPKGWTWRKVILGTTTYYCAKRRVIKPCPKGWRKVRGTCKPPVIIKPCPKGWRKVRGKCIPPVLRNNPARNIKPVTRLNRSNQLTHTGMMSRVR